MSEREGGAPPWVDGGEELDLGALLRQAFDPAKGEYPPHFAELALSPVELEAEIARQEWPAVEERLLRRFFASMGQDYDVWRRERRRRRLRQVGQYLLALLALVALALGAGAPVWWGSSWVPRATPGPQHYDSVAAIQPYFAVPLPAAAPAGYRLVDVGLAWSPAGTPRATLLY
jgi:hypothetical protein